VVKKPGLIIFGAGHIGTVLAGFGQLLGFAVTVIDNRPDFASEERFTDTATVITGDYDRIFADLETDGDTYIVIVTHRHEFDQEILEFCVDRPYRYLGMIGSRTKVKKTFDLLRQKNVKEEIINTIHSPIGFDIGGDTPEEIALAIAAEIVAIRNGKEVLPR
jgi:xanthine dehydrogenase accessory factor